MYRFFNSSFSFITLFDGIGGFRLACESVGGHCVFTSEEDRYSRQTYNENFGDTLHAVFVKIVVA